MNDVMVPNLFRSLPSLLFSKDQKWVDTHSSYNTLTSTEPLHGFSAKSISRYNVSGGRSHTLLILYYPHAGLSMTAGFYS